MPKSLFFYVKLVYIPYIILDLPVMFVFFKQKPVKSLGFAPFLKLSYLTAHKQKLFAGMSHHIRKGCSEIGELLPGIAGHFID
jgi:hypothetical protein